jgi:chaperonin GroEL (HSP60 family)
VCVVKRTVESKAVAQGGGSVETALSVYMEHFAETMVAAFVNAHHLNLSSPAKSHEKALPRLARMNIDIQPGDLVVLH